MKAVEGHPARTTAPAVNQVGRFGTFAALGPARSLRGVAQAISVIVAVAVVLAVSATNLEKERQQLFAESTRGTVADAKEAGRSLQRQLRALERDAQLMVNQVAPTPSTRAFDATTLHSVILSAFDALVAVVRSYRTVMLFDATGALLVEAVDPTEDRARSEAGLIEMSREVARVALAAHHGMLSGPLPLGGERRFYFQALPTGASSVVVIAVDAVMFFEAALPVAQPMSALVVTDPTGEAWLGCPEPTTCHPTPARELFRGLPSVPPGVGRSLAPEITARLGLGRAPGLLALSTASAATGDWQLWVARSAAAIVEREDKLLHRLIGTAVGAALAVMAVGLLVLRQQRRAAVLEEGLRHAEELAALSEQLIRAEKLGTVGVLSAGLAHEIGTPLAVIRGRAECIAAEIGPASPLAEDVQAIDLEIDHISRIIRRVLEFGRNVPAAREAVSFPEAVAHARRLFDRKLAARRVALDVVIESGLAALAAEPVQFEQVLVNLVTNACDACALGGSIRISAGPVGQHGVRITFRDDGCGVPPEHLNAVFDPFFTTKKRGEGSGLGLSIVADIVRNHGGDVQLSSHSGRGTTVTLLWPAWTGPTSGVVEGLRPRRGNVRADA